MLSSIYLLWLNIIMQLNNRANIFDFYKRKHLNVSAKQSIFGNTNMYNNRAFHGFRFCNKNISETSQRHITRVHFYKR